METQHPIRWKQYLSCNKESKTIFFKDNCFIPFKNTIPSHFTGKHGLIIHTVGKDIVDIIVRGMIVHPEDDF
jgi:hypothetical protein